MYLFFLMGKIAIKRNVVMALSFIANLKKHNCVFINRRNTLHSFILLLYVYLKNLPCVDFY